MLCQFFLYFLCQHVKVALKGHPAIIDDELQHDIKVEESTWTIEDRKSVKLFFEKVKKTLILGLLSSSNVVRIMKLTKIVT